VVWFFLTPLAYGGAPGLVLHLTRLVLLVPVARIAGPMLGEALRPLLYGLVGFVLVDQMREILEVVPALERTVLAFQCAAGAAALLWLSRDLDRLAGKPGRRDLTRPVFDTARRVGLLLLLAALAANVLGYVRLARLLYLGTAHGAYAGVVLYTLAQVVEGLIVLSLGTWAAQALHVVQRHRRVILRRARRLVRVGMTVFWAGWVLRSFSILDDVLDGLGTALRAHLTIGQINLSLGDLVAFAITLWATFLISRLLRVVLEDEFFPRMHLGRGVPYAVASFSSYTVLLVGFFVALAAAGIGFDRLAVVAGALGVGVGFGLQSIVNNFVSGLILLFERPIQIGDVVQLGDVLGTVRRIGLRSSILHTSEGAEIIVPNANLIAQQVVNWTLSDRKRRIDLAVGVAYGTDPEQVLALLIRVARGQSDVLDEPEPSALFMGFGDSALNFELRAWTGNLEDCLKVRSGLAVAVNRALAEAGIEIPFPQRDLHVRSVDPVATALPLPGRKTGSGT
jgi:small-conductance mechanosensitive channel